MTGRLRWTRRAQRDLFLIGQFISRDNPEAAHRLVETLLARAEAAVRMPQAGRRVPELLRDDIREVVAGNYRMVYRLRDRGISILRVFESHRDFPAL